MLITAADGLSRYIGRVYLDGADYTKFGVYSASPDEGWIEVTRDPHGNRIEGGIGLGSVRLHGAVEFELAPGPHDSALTTALNARWPGVLPYIRLGNSQGNSAHVC
jgi:hypothetical protein